MELLSTDIYHSNSIHVLPSATMPMYDTTFTSLVHITNSKPTEAVYNVTHCTAVGGPLIMDQHVYSSISLLLLCFVIKNSDTKCD